MYPQHTHTHNAHTHHMNTPHTYTVHTAHADTFTARWPISSFSPALHFQPAYPNGPYTLLKIYSYKLHCQSGLGPGARRDHRKGWPLSCPSGSRDCTQTQYHPGDKMAGSEGCKGPASRAGAGLGGRGRGAQRGLHPLVLQVQTDAVPPSLSMYRYLQQEVMSNRPQSCKRNAPLPPPPTLTPAHPRTP